MNDDYIRGKQAGREDRNRGLRLEAFYQFNEGVGYTLDDYARGYRAGQERLDE